MSPNGWRTRRPDHANRVPGPRGFDSPIEFHALGLPRRRRSWCPPSQGYRTLALAPFVNRTGLDAVGRLSGNERILVSRQEELDKLPERALDAWNDVFVLSETAQGEAEEGPAETEGDDEATGGVALRLPAEGMPVDRMHHVLRGLLDSPEKSLRFLRALLGGLDAVLGWAREEAETGAPGPWGMGAGGETLLDDLVRTASRNPERLKPVRRLIEDLRKTDEGRRVVPDELFAVWKAVEEALAEQPRS